MKKIKYLFAAFAVSLLSGCDKEPTSETLKINIENGKANAIENYEQAYSLNDYAFVKLTANENCTLPDQISVYSGEEFILPETYTYVLSETKTSADFVIKMTKSFDVSIKAVEELGTLYIGSTEVTASGDYTSLLSDQPQSGKVMFDKETNTLTLNGATVKASKIGTSKFYDPKMGLDTTYLFAYTGTKPLTIALSGTNRFYLTDTVSTDFKKGFFVSVNGGELDFTGISTNEVYGAGHSIIYSSQKVTLTNATLWSTYSGSYGIFAKDVVFDESTVNFSSVSTEDEKYVKASQYAIYSYNTTINKSAVVLKGFQTGIYATNLKFYHTLAEIEANGKGIDCDWFTAFGQPNGDNHFTTEISVKAKKGGISSYDTQEWNYAKADVVTEKGHAIYTVDTTIYAYNSNLKGVNTDGEGDGIHAFRLYCVNSTLYGESNGTFNAGIRSSIYSAQSYKDDHQPFIYLENSIATGKGLYGAIFGIGSIIQNGETLPEGWTDGVVKYLRHQHARNTYVFGLFSPDIESCEEIAISSGGTHVFIPENPIKECTFDATYK